MNRIIIFFLIALALLANSGCVKEKKDCVLPPPTFDFTIVDSAHNSLINSSNANTVKIYFHSPGESKRYISDLKSVSSYQNPENNYLTSTDIIQVAGKSGVSSFTIEIGGTKIADLELKTVVAHSDCSNWAQISGLKFNGKVVEYKPFTPVIFSLQN